MPHPVDPVSVQFRSDDGSLTPDNALFRWGLAMEEAMSKSSRVRPSEEQLKTRLEKAGFVDVQALTVKQPFGPWAKAKYGSLDCRSAVWRIAKRI
jgi:ABC-type sulfate transport system substrate-binding protein